MTITPSTIHRTHHDGCKTRLYLWILVALEPPTVDEEEEETLEEEGANTANTITNLPIVSKTMPQTQGTHQMPVSNVDKWDITPENALKGSNVPETTGKTKRPT